MVNFLQLKYFFLVLETWGTGLLSCHMHYHMCGIPVFYIEIGDGDRGIPGRSKISELGLRSYEQEILCQIRYKVKANT